MQWVRGRKGTFLTLHFKKYCVKFILQLLLPREKKRLARCPFVKMMGQMRFPSFPSGF